MMVSEPVAALIQKKEKPLFGQRFRHVGDLVTNAATSVVIRGYAQPEGETWVIASVEAPARVEFQFWTRFERDDVWLRTSEVPISESPGGRPDPTRSGSDPRGPP